MKGALSYEKLGSAARWTNPNSQQRFRRRRPNDPVDAISASSYLQKCVKYRRGEAMLKKAASLG
jgi:hypothetical protein